MVRGTPPYGHASTYQISLTYLERQKCYCSDKKILFKKQLFDLEVKVSQRSLRYVTHHLMLMHQHIWTILFKKTIIWPWGQRSRSHEGHYGMWHTVLWSYTHTNYHWPISKDKNVMARTRKYYLKNNYLTLRSKVKVPRRSLRYAIHHLMVMHPHTNYHWPISKDKKVMVRTSFAEKKRKKKSD
jgi:acyl-CoA thioesterase FadM